MPDTGTLTLITDRVATVNASRRRGPAVGGPRRPGRRNGLGVQGHRALPRRRLHPRRAQPRPRRRGRARRPGAAGGSRRCRGRARRRQAVAVLGASASARAEALRSDTAGGSRCRPSTAGRWRFPTRCAAARRWWWRSRRGAAAATTCRRGRGLHDELGPEGFGVVAVAIDEDPEAVRPFTEGIGYPVLIDHDPGFTDSYGLTNVPRAVARRGGPHRPTARRCVRLRPVQGVPQGGLAAAPRGAAPLGARWRPAQPASARRSTTGRPPTPSSAPTSTTASRSRPLARGRGGGHPRLRPRRRSWHPSTSRCAGPSCRCGARTRSSATSSWQLYAEWEAGRPAVLRPTELTGAASAAAAAGAGGVAHAGRSVCRSGWPATRTGHRSEGTPGGNAAGRAVAIGASRRKRRRARDPVAERAGWATGDVLDHRGDRRGRGGRRGLVRHHEVDRRGSRPWPAGRRAPLPRLSSSRRTGRPVTSPMMRAASGG